MLKRIATIVFLASCTVALAHEPRVVPPGSVPEISFPGHKTYLLSESGATASKVAVLELELPARTFGAPPHVHSKEDEHFYVLSGQVEFLNGDKTVSVGQGGMVVLPRGGLHGFWNLSDQPAKLLLIVTPGEFASFFDATVAEIRKQEPNNPKLVGEIIARVAASYGVSLHPDTIPESAVPVLPK